jgi:hypothetical protein
LNWCQNFVQTLELCPWAKASLETAGSIQFFVLSGWQEDDEDGPSRLVEQVARRFVREILPPDRDNNITLLERTSIYFILFLNNNNNNSTSFADNFYDFYDWFSMLEENWEDQELENVIIAPFHPDWQFAIDGADDEGVQQALSFEKKSPVPLVSLVSARVVEQAGEVVTARISQHNRQVLLGQSREGPNILEELWIKAIYDGEREML